MSRLLSPALQALQQRLGHVFADAGLLSRAVTHKSFGADHYERLEFLGDAVLSLGVSALLYRRFDRSDEGDLTRVRAHLVRQDTLHQLALQLGLPEVMRLYEATLKRAELQFERLPAGYFTGVLERLGDRAVCVLYWVDEHLVAFNLMLVDVVIRFQFRARVSVPIYPCLKLM